MNTGDTIKGYKLIQRLDTGGSDREFFRCTKDNNTFVMVYDQDIEYYVTLQNHLLNKGVPVPGLHSYDLGAKLMVQEDIGDVSLYLLSKSAREVTSTYRQAIDVLIKLQVDGRQSAPVQVYYDRVHIQWEQEYFKNCFLIQYAKISKSVLDDIDSDLRDLADQVLTLTQPLSDHLMHRDFQSQNIYVKAGKVRIIDFQSARIGPLTYDLAALLRDAYVHIDQVLEKELFTYYISKIQERGLQFNEKDFWHAYELTCLQRNMQALGAFANLSLNKGKDHFRQHIPRGLTLLRSGLEGKNLPHLEAVLTNITA
jgi:aminoglycoside/choline kinase family phosphotransferase